VRGDALEARIERELERLDLRQLGEDAVPTRADLLALAVLDEECLLHLAGS
jgi:hypothetical protein